jgi:hypothetical protein
LRVSDWIVIGGFVGPGRAYELLEHYSDREMTFRFVSNVYSTVFTAAGRDLMAADAVHRLLEALHNARHHVQFKRGCDIRKFGTETARRSPFRDWVGGPEHARNRTDYRTGVGARIARFSQLERITIW